VVKRALDLAESDDCDGEPTRTRAQRRHDALVDLSRFFLDHQHGRLGGRHRPHLNVIVGLDDLEAGRGSQAVDGPQLDGVTISRLACDSALHRVVMSGRSSVLDYGTSTRTIPVNLFNAVVVRDEACRWPGCDRPRAWCEAHHVQWFVHGGPTAIENLVLLCCRHHHRLHQPGWHAKLRPDGSFSVTDPDGKVRTSHPPGVLAPMLA
jgi:5-methylcytosine-specific restriction protein A